MSAQNSNNSDVKAFDEFAEADRKFGEEVAGATPEQLKTFDDIAADERAKLVSGEESLEEAEVGLSVRNSAALSGEDDAGVESVG